MGKFLEICIFANFILFSEILFLMLGQGPCFSMMSVVLVTKACKRFSRGVGVRMGEDILGLEALGLGLLHD